MGSTFKVLIPILFNLIFIVQRFVCLKVKNRVGMDISDSHQIRDICRIFFQQGYLDAGRDAAPALKNVTQKSCWYPHTCPNISDKLCKKKHNNNNQRGVFELMNTPLYPAYAPASNSMTWDFPVLVYVKKKPVSVPQNITARRHPTFGA